MLFLHISIYVFDPAYERLNQWSKTLHICLFLLAMTLVTYISLTYIMIDNIWPLHTFSLGVLLNGMGFSCKGYNMS